MVDADQVLKHEFNGYGFESPTSTLERYSTDSGEETSEELEKDQVTSVSFSTSLTALVHNPPSE